MKILYHHRIASKDGQYVHIEAITTELVKLGHELVMVAPSATTTPFDKLPDVELLSDTTSYTIKWAAVSSPVAASAECHQ